jgi:hypothetical protein
MKHYRVRKNSIADWTLTILAVVGLILALNLPSTIENLIGW